MATTKHTLYCKIQNRLGAMDRILGALTHRGFIPEQFIAQMDTAANCLQVIVTFEGDNLKLIEKTIKFLANQVLVIEVQHLAESLNDAPIDEPTAAPRTSDKTALPVTPPMIPNVAPLFLRRIKERKLAHVHNA